MVRPVMEETDLQRLAELPLDALRPEFLEQLDILKVRSPPPPRRAAPHRQRFHGPVADSEPPTPQPADVCALVRSLSRS